MGRRDRERFEKTGKVFRGGALVDPTEAREVSDSEREEMHRKGYSALQDMSTNKQVAVLRDSLHQNRISRSRLRGALEDNAHKEMQKGADKLRKKGKPVTVDALLEEYREEKNRDFRELATEVGLDEAWFVSLAEEEC